ncbi:hypothetical protein AB6A40_001844 [Gnathostoma spinigerum]|uniref:SCP domain-containing protein n=1 Tax=Gnathostoma spinigerum TaxID=75299 RepID=A0ABD6EFP5_9BILA
MPLSGRKTILHTHNLLRSKLATGKVQNKTDGYLPKASNMNELIYDCELEKGAQKWADRCKFEHSSAFEVGENIYWMYGTNLAHSGSAELFNTILNSWWDEVSTFGISSLKYLWNFETGHFTQQAWAETVKIGCGYAKCDKNPYIGGFIVCHYSPPGNWQDENIYQPGEPCSKCKGNCSKEYEGLCKVSNIAEFRN